MKAANSQSDAGLCNPPGTARLMDIPTDKRHVRVRTRGGCSVNIELGHAIGEMSVLRVRSDMMRRRRQMTVIRDYPKCRG